MRRATALGITAATLALAAVAVLAYRREWSWFHAPDEGAGPFPPWWVRVPIVVVMLGVPIAAVMAVHLRARPAGLRRVLLAVNVVAGGAVVLAALPGLGDGRVEFVVTEDGFRYREAAATTADRLVFYNARREPVTVCLGADGHCGGDQAGPPRLRGEGLTVPSGRRVSAGPAAVVSWSRITLAGLGPQIPRRTLELNVVSGRG